MGEALISIDRAREMLAYDAITGVFTWRVSPHPRLPAGTIAGSHRGGGYRQVKVDGRCYKAHRLAWFMTFGAWPLGDIDHVNGDQSDNRLENLRDVSRTVNAQNRLAPHPKNALGLIGVAQDRNRFRADITVDGRSFYLGAFDTPEQAHAAYLLAKARLHPQARQAQNHPVQIPERRLRNRARQAKAEIFRLRSSGLSQRAISKAVGLAQSQVSRILGGAIHG